MHSSIHRALKLALLFHAFGWPVNANDSFLAETLVRKRPIQKVLDHQPIKHTTCHNSILTGPIETTMCDYETIESVNDELFGNLSELVEKPFFRYFQVDLYRECPFWPDDGSCNNPGCAITSVDEGEYFDLRLVPERYTGYSGKDAQRVWKSIYEENCFGLSELNLMTGKSPAPVSLPDTMIEVLHEDEQESAAQCLEKRVYYKVISGLHASISTHICHEYLNQTTGEWHPNLNCFISRVASHPERLQYIYFDTILLLRAVSRLGPYLSAFDYCSTGTHEDDKETLQTLTKVLDIAKDAGAFDESILFRGENANILKEEFKTHFRNVTRIMDCVGCDKCRLWGKIQTTGLATAMKILFELDETALDPRANSDLLQRSEVVALVNTLFRFSESLKAVDTFRKLWQEMDAAEAENIVKQTEKATAAHAQAFHSANVDYSRNYFDVACEQSMSALRHCKHSIEENVTQAMTALGHVFNAVLSAFRPSRKERGPGATYGDL
ncbi:hypothetical protein CVT25_011039 [Psilocybe cyanescens]|uniref:Endoplasmic oxidoreductin-1 n=1 Tax=Psilocybe cyanescens TaxID=93625 RepID=A0A409WFD8_PSICY|nr:hypothetical protein CVT25_011039 [Psilocybe cyanescens]